MGLTRKISSGGTVANFTTYIGENGHLFYDSLTGQMRISDGQTPGGLPLRSQTVVSGTAPLNPADGNLWFDEFTGRLYIRFEGAWIDTNPAYVLPIASTTVVGGIKIGPGMTVGTDGVLTIDAGGLPVSFGDFYASTNNLSTINTNEDLNLLSNGTGSINAVGIFHVHSTSGGLSDTPVLSVDGNGFTVIHVPTISIGQAGLTINGNSTINSSTLPQVAGTTFRSIGNDGISNVVAIDANGTNITSGVTTRVARGTASAPSAVQSGDTIGRFASVGWGTTSYVVDPMSGRAASDIRFVATENYTDAHGGSKVQFYTSPTGGTVRTLSAEISPEGLNLPNSGSGIKFSDATTQTIAFVPSAIPNSLTPTPTDYSLSLGSSTHRWGDLYLGKNSLHMLDETTNADIALTVNNGTMYLNGVASLAVGELTIVNNTIQSDIASRNINLGDPADTGLFTVGRQTVITTPNLGSFTSALVINGATTALTDPSPLTFNGTLIHGVAQAGQNARLVFDTFGTGLYNTFVGRYARGTIASPTSVQNNDIILRVSANGWGSTGFASGSSARIDFMASENFTDSTKGTRIDFWTTPVGSETITKNASVSNDGFVGTGIRFTGDDSYQTTAGIPLTQKAVPSAAYVATLGVDGKLDPSQIPSSLTGAIVFKGTWDASTNTPALSDTTPAGLDTGWEYVVSVGGTLDIGDGSKTFLAGDIVIFDGTHWKQIPSGNAFISLTSGGHITVNQTTGAMILGSDATPVSIVSTIVSRDSSGNFAANTITANLTGNVTGNVTGSVSGNAGTVTNGVYTTGTYSDPTWLTISKSKVGLSSVENTALSTWNGTSNINTVGTLTTGSIGSGFTAIANSALAHSSVTIGSTSISLGSTATTIAGLTSVTSSSFVGALTGNADTVTNGVYTSGSYSDPSWLTISKSKVGLSVVENTALSTWPGTVNISTVGTLTSGTIGAGFTAIANARLANSTITINSTAVSLGGSITGIVTTADTGTVTNTMLAGSIANAKLVNSTISGVALGGTLSTLTIGTHLTGTSYNGSAGVTIATDATNVNTASTIVARDGSGNFSAGTITANLTGTASTATNLAAATSILAGTLSITPATVNKTGSSTQTFTLSGLTTSHKIIIKSASDLTYGLFITASYASATNTVSIQFQNFSGNNITPGTFNVTYWAWV